MLENQIRAGAPSILPYANMIGGGNGGLTSQGLITRAINGSHTFLPFVANGINWCPTQGQDVVSAHFTGCIMAYFVDNGVAKVAHISTGADFGDCLPAWNNLKRNFTNVLEFRPSDYNMNVAHDRCYGLITSNLGLYTITTQAPHVALAAGGHAQADQRVVRIEVANELNARRP